MEQEKDILYRVCPPGNSMPQKAIPLKNSVLNIDFEYEFQQKSVDQRRGFFLILQR